MITVKLYMKNVVFSFFIVFLLVPTILFGQYLKEEPIVSNPNKFSIGMGIGMGNMFGDLITSVPTLVGRFGIGQQITKNLQISVEYYNGKLSSKDEPNNWTTGISSTSNFYSIDLSAKISYDVFFSNYESTLSKLLKGFYLGSGIGYVNASVLNITQQLKPKDTTLIKAIKMKDESIYIPLNIGWRYPFKKFLGHNRTQLMINYSTCYTFSNFIDGYNLSLLTNNHNHKVYDVYSIFTVGLSFTLGNNNDSYYKPKNQKGVLLK